MTRVIVSVLISLSLISCAETPYQKARISGYGGRQGYHDKEIRPHTFLLEYSHIGGNDYNLEKNKEFWHRRASELCPNGYDATLEVIDPINAKFSEFVCPEKFCTKYPLVSGIIQCKGE